MSSKVARDNIPRNKAAPAVLVRFHTALKLSLMTHSPKHCAETGRLVAKAGSIPSPELSATHRVTFMEGLALLGTLGRHVNVLQQLTSFLKNHLSNQGKQDLLGLIGDYRHGLLPLIVLLVMLRTGSSIT
jgi:uncharacterized protein YbgA (DUF1722 family)